MGLTNLGITLRDIRIKNNELLYDMAKKLDISSSNLSHIEQGLKVFTWQHFYTIIKKYGIVLTDIEKKILFDNINRDIISQAKDLKTQISKAWNNFGFKGWKRYLYYNGWCLYIYYYNFNGQWCLTKDNTEYFKFNDIFKNHYNLIWFKKRMKMRDYILKKYDTEKYLPYSKIKI